jgi:hypothetical protein
MQFMETTIDDLKEKVNEAIDNIKEQFCKSLNTKERMQEDETENCG